MATFDDEPRKKPTTHEVGQDLSSLSVHELEERIELLRGEVERLLSAKSKKSASMAAADTFFKAKS